MKKTFNRENLPERILIEGFLGLPPMRLDLSPITVLIGSHGTGKSVCAKLVHLFRDYPTQFNPERSQIDFMEITGHTAQRYGDTEEGCEKRSFHLRIHKVDATNEETSHLAFGCIQFSLAKALD